MAKKSRNLDCSDAHSESQSHRKRRRTDDDEYGFDPLYISRRDADLVSKFIPSHREQITLPDIKSTQLRCLAYTYLANLLLVLQNNPVLRILERKRSCVMTLIHNLRCLSFGGSWLDSLESLLVDNVENDSFHRKKLKDLEQQLKHRNDFLRGRVMWLRCQQKQKTDLAIENAEILGYRLKWFKRQKKLVKSELANVMEKRKAVSVARKSLKFFYET